MTAEVPPPRDVPTNEEPASSPAARLPSTNWRPWLGKALFEAALIVFSVLLALTLDGWREDAAERERFAEVVQSLADEVQLNRNLLAGTFYIEHHRRLLEHYQTRANAGASEGADEAFKGGLHPPPFRDTAWASLGDSGVAHVMPFALRAELAGIYRDQSSIDDIYRALVAGFSQPRVDRETEAYRRDLVRVLAVALTDMVAAENRLLRQYEEIEPTLRALAR
jgi:hypothetical protein